MLPEDLVRFQAWKKGLTELGLKVEEIDSCNWRLLGSDSVIAIISYDASKPYSLRFHFQVSRTL